MESSQTSKVTDIWNRHSSQIVAACWSISLPAEKRTEIGLRESHRWACSSKHSALCPRSKLFTLSTRISMQTSPTQWSNISCRGIRMNDQTFHFPWNNSTDSKATGIWWWNVSSLFHRARAWEGITALKLQSQFRDWGTGKQIRLRKEKEQPLISWQISHTIPLFHPIPSCSTYGWRLKDGAMSWV